MNHPAEDRARGPRRGWRAYLGALLAAFMLCACLGVIEGVLLRMQAPGSPAPGFGLIPGLAAFAAVYGWTGLLLAALFSGPAAWILSRRGADSTRILAMAVAAAFSAPLLIQLGYWLREIFQRGWWNRYEGLLILCCFPLLYILSITLFTRWMPFVCGSLLKGRARALIVALLAILLISVLWPDWRRRGEISRCGEDGDRVTAAEAATPNIILITIDALRRDATGALDTGAAPTPALDAFAAESLIFSNAWSTSCWTLPAMAALMTGLPARAMGMDVETGIPVQVETLAEIALRNGYRTRAVATNPFLTPDYGLDMGFQDFEHSLVLEPLIPAQRSLLVRALNHFLYRYTEIEDAEIVLGKATAAARQLSRERGPWLLWTHLMEAHLPYRTHEPRSGGRAPYASDLPDHPIFDDRGLPVASLWRVRGMASTIPDSLASAVRRVYDDEVTYLDARLGAFFDDLKRLGLYRESLIIITADHGEEFFEHAGFEHGHALWPEISGVPLFVRLPDAAGAGTRIDRDCSLLDILPSLGASLGWTLPDSLAGCDGLWTLQGAASPGCGSSPERPRIIEMMLYGEAQSGMLAWPFFGHRDARGDMHWYDLGEDPGALRIISDPPGSVRTIQQRADARLDRWDGYSRRFDSENDANRGPSAEVRRQLKALGY